MLRGKWTLLLLIQGKNSTQENFAPISITPFCSSFELHWKTNKNTKRYRLQKEDFRWTWFPQFMPIHGGCWQHDNVIIGEDKYKCNLFAEMLWICHGWHCTRYWVWLTVKWRPSPSPKLIMNEHKKKDLHKSTHAPHDGNFSAVEPVLQAYFGF